MKKTNRYYEIKSKNFTYGLIGQFNSEEEALAEINLSYERAKEQGYDNRHEKWSIVCVDWAREFNDDGDFLKEEITRFVVDHVEFSTYDEKFVFVY